MNNMASPAGMPPQQDEPRLVRFMLAPHSSVTDRLQQEHARLLGIISLTLIVGVVLALFFRRGFLAGGLLLLVLLAAAYGLSRSRHYARGSILLCAGLAVFPYLSWWITPGLYFQAALMIFVPLCLLIASTLLSRRDFLILAVLTVVLTAAAPVYAAPVMTVAAVLPILGMIISVSSLLYLIMLYRRGLDAYRDAAYTALRREMLQVKARLDLRVAEIMAEIDSRGEQLALRAQEMEASTSRLEELRRQMDTLAKMSALTASAADLPALLTEAARLIGQHLGLYHVGIFLLDEAGTSAGLSAASSEGGHTLLAREYALPVTADHPVASSIATGQVRVVLDAQADPSFVPEPELAATCSEIIMPLKSGEQILGALDLHSTVPGEAQQIELPFLSLLAAQLASAIANGRLLEGARRSLAEAESHGRQYLRESWKRVAREQRLLGFRFGASGVAPIAEPIPAHANNGTMTHFPIELRGEIIGELAVHAPNGRAWSQDELDLIHSVAERVALSAENARLFEETSRRAERERMVSEITSRIRSSNDPDQMIKLAVQELKNALGVSRVEVVPQRLPGDSTG